MTRDEILKMNPDDTIYTFSLNTMLASGRPDYVMDCIEQVLPALGKVDVFYATLKELGVEEHGNPAHFNEWMKAWLCVLLDLGSTVRSI